MFHPKITDLTLLDLVPFGEPGLDAAGLARNFFALRLSPPEWTDYQPGQFVMLRPESFGAELVWGRPFSICRLSGRDLTVFFQVVGRGTRRLAELKPGDKVQCLGPLGNGFQIEDGPTLLLAGGIGLAPFVGYAERHPAPQNLRLMFGHRMPLDCYPFESFSDGFNGGASGRMTAENHPEKSPADLDKFIAAMDEAIAGCAAQSGLVLACGPTPFLRSVQTGARRHGARAQLSLENRMACGVGACLGCVVKVNPHKPPLRGAHATEAAQAAGGEVAALPVSACSCGPVFWSDTIEL